MIFAWNNADPVTGVNDWQYHGALNRVTQTTLLLSYKDEELEAQSILPSDTYSHALTFNNVI